jgi:hypothetical protein
MKLTKAPRLPEEIVELDDRPNALTDLYEPEETLPVGLPGITLTPVAGVKCQVG